MTEQRIRVMTMIRPVPLRMARTPLPPPRGATARIARSAASSQRFALVPLGPARLARAAHDPYRAAAPARAAICDRFAEPATNTHTHTLALIPKGIKAGDLRRRCEGLGIMNASQCGNDRPGFGVIAVTPKTAII
jgi:hypothetical protein